MSHKKESVGVCVCVFEFVWEKMKGKKEEEGETVSLKRINLSLI